MTGEELRRLRMKAGMSQTELATAAGVTSQTISRIERGVTEAKGATEKLLLAALSPSEEGGARRCQASRPAMQTRTEMAAAVAAALEGWTLLELIRDNERRCAASGDCLLVRFADGGCLLCALETIGGLAAMQGHIDRRSAERAAAALGAEAEGLADALRRGS